MPIVAIIDLIGFRKLKEAERSRVIGVIERVLREFNNEYGDKLLAKAALTGGDSVELIAESHTPILYLLHRLLIEEVRFRVGISAGKITIVRDYADECDGPALWEARNIVEKAKRTKQPVEYSTNLAMNGEEAGSVKVLVLAYLLLLKMTQKQRVYCYDMLWKKMTITGIAKKHGTTKSNVSSTIKKSMCKALTKVITSNNL